MRRRTFIKAVAAVAAFPATLWSMVRGPKPTYHTITRLVVTEPPGIWGQVLLKSDGELTCPGHTWVGRATTERVITCECPIPIQPPWEASHLAWIDDRMSANDALIEVEWTDEHGKNHRN